MVGIYFSGTGNSKFCIEKFLSYYDKEAEAISIEENEAVDAIKENQKIVFVYPVYFSNLPKIVRDFIDDHQMLFAGKEIFLIATMGLFSGDGTGCAARLFRKYGADITGGLHLKMPDCIGDEKALKKTMEQNHELIVAADEKIKKAVESLKKDRAPRRGLGFGIIWQDYWGSGCGFMARQDIILISFI